MFSAFSMSCLIPRAAHKSAGLGTTGTKAKSAINRALCGTGLFTVRPISLCDMKQSRVRARSAGPFGSQGLCR